MVNLKRVRNLRKGNPGKGPVLYWMSRDQRVQDNWALAYVVECAENYEQTLIVVFTLIDALLGATWRQSDFMIKALRKVEKKLNDLNIPFIVLKGEPADTLPHFIEKHHICHMVTDFDPLRIKQQWISQLIKKIRIETDEVDAHNIVPCWQASDKEEYSAYTIRPKISRMLPEFLDGFPPLIRQRNVTQGFRNNWEALAVALSVDHSVQPVDGLIPGEDAAIAVMERFLNEKLGNYGQKRNDPNAEGTSGLSPYIRFGHIAAQRIALEVLKNFPRNPDADAFLEELIIRKELADNFCYYNPDYDRVAGFRQWARMSLDHHRNDRRAYVYTPEQFEKAATHDDLWNAAQLQMVHTGMMHNYMRMYWAKKILEWTRTPEEAYGTALYLNDKYQLDGRCPNGYAGCAWSIGGVHDRAWGTRTVFGKIRYMSKAGCERKFDVKRYVSKYLRSPDSSLSDRTDKHAG
ncbi:MAG: deoxyribodipyrimidine photo-lyase [Bacteroidales bacterium]|nr:deoxyribodipyrimidine photo-lyase [Bacteroidales bacterium]